tara:strand:+ start:660 stop:953 length:294 start_codon:yes stop_codon:yes gene_type:complete
MEIKDQIKHLTNKFATDMFKNGVESAVSSLCIVSRSIGAKRPNLADVYSNSEEDAVEFGCVLFFDVLGGKMTLGRFVESVFYHAAVQVAYEVRDGVA